MPYPEKYVRQYDYSSYQNSNPNRPLPADRVNADLNAAGISTEQIINFLKKSLRADGAIMNGAVGRDQIDPSVNLGFTPPTEWETNTLYSANTSTVWYSNAFYSALVTHTSTGTFDASKWLLIADFSALADEAALEAIASNPNLYAISQLASAADKGIVFTGSGTASTFDLTAWGRSLMAATTTGGAQTTLGITSFMQTVLDDADGPTALNTLGALPKAGGTMTGTLTLAADPVSALQAATKQYVDSVAQGLDTKASVLVATTANITLSAPQTIDGVAVVAGNRVLVKNQSTASQNGIYVVAAGAWTRAADADTWAELPGAFTFVERGTVNADCGFVCTVDDGGTLGTTSVTFAQFSGAGTYSATGGVTLTGTQFSITTNGITNAMRAQMAAYTLKGNITGSLGNESDFTIGGLTNKSTPIGADRILLEDSAASGALKYSTLTQAIGALSSGVASIAGNTGAFTLSNGIKNVANDIQADASYFQNFLTGLGMANNATDATNDIDISPGVAADSTNVALVKLASALTKQLDVAWAAGNNAGGRMSAAAIANGTYHVWLIQRSDTGAVDAGFDVSPSAPTMPSAAWDRKRCIGSIIREGGVIVPFLQDGNDFQRLVPINDVSATNPGTSAVLRTLSIPTGRRLKANISVGALYAADATNTGYGVLITDPAQTDTVPTTTVSQIAITSIASNNMLAKSAMQVFTNTSAQVRSRLSASGANFTLYITTFGWTDTRGQ